MWIMICEGGNFDGVTFSFFNRSIKREKEKKGKGERITLVKPVSNFRSVIDTIRFHSDRYKR